MVRPVSEHRPDILIFKVQVNKGDSEDPVQVTVTTNITSPATAFIFKRDPWTTKTIVNMPPCVNAGPDQNIAGTTAALQGQAKDDGDPNNALTTNWSKVSGPGSVSFGNPNTPATSASFSANGSYILRLTANDGQLQASDEVMINVNSSGGTGPTIASFTPTSGTAGTIVTISGSNFTGVTSVAFNDTPATSFTVNSSTQIVATVPASATTGKIMIATTSSSGISASDFVDTGSNLNTFTFNPTDDAYVQSLNPTSNFGRLKDLRTERNSASDVSNIYIKFNVSGITGAVQSAKLRLYVSDPSPDGGAVYLVSNNYQASMTPWIECGLNWNNAPGITSFTPDNGSEDTEVTIFGNKFSGTTSVTFNGKPATIFTAESNTKPRANVPANATTGKIKVTNVNGSGSFAKDFIVAATPVITAFMPSSGSAGTEITITGSNFTGTFSFGLMNDNSDAGYYSSKESSGTTNDPQLVIQMASQPTQHKLIVNTVGSGTVKLNPPSANGSYNVGTTVQLTATPATGFQFSGWSGGLNGSANPATNPIGNVIAGNTLG